MRCESCKEFLELGAIRYCPTCGAAVPAPPPDPLIGQTIGDRYTVSSLVAEGGMGRVYSAEQTMGGRRRNVAIKVLLAEYSGREVDIQRFQRECSTVSELEHPNTIKFYDYGDTKDGDLYIAMEFLSGQSLAQALKAGAMSPERVDLIIGQICGSLQEAHDRGIIHRDLKPDNIILTSPGGQPDFVKVLDFGIAKRVRGNDPKLTPLGVVLGSPPYMSPEQFTLQEIDARSDIYSLGVVTFQALTGKLPFDAGDPLEWAHLHINCDPLPWNATEAGSMVPQNMQQAVMRALAKDPEARPATMREFYQELTLGTALPGRPPSLLPASPELLGMVRGSAPPRRGSSAPPNRMSDRFHDETSRDVSEPIPLFPRAAEVPTIHENPSVVPGGDPTTPEISVHDVRASSLSMESRDAVLADGTSSGFGKAGTVVMVASRSEPPQRLTMPDLLPPTVRDAAALAEFGNRGRGKVFVVMGICLLFGVALTLGLYFAFREGYFTSTKKPPRSDASSKKSEKPPPETPLDVQSREPELGGTAQSPTGTSTAAAPPNEELSPCQSAIFAAVSGKCDAAKRSFTRCSPDSPYAPSASRTMSGLCP